MDKYLNFYSDTERAEIVSAIKEAEKLSSGEIRVHLEDHCDHLAQDRAAFIFEQLHMHETEQRNGVLFYISVCDHDFAVIGDIGIHSKVGQDYWGRLSHELETEFRSGRFKEGTIKAIQKVGAVLSEYFPRRSNDQNELDDSISMGKI